LRNQLKQWQAHAQALAREGRGIWWVNLPDGFHTGATSLDDGKARCADHYRRHARANAQAS
jgi:hypothetical protein